jgi:putative oxidoreductase
MAEFAENEEPRPILPGVRGLYGRLVEFHWPLIRVTAGVILLTHGWPKLMAGAQVVAANTLAKRGIEPALAFAYALMFIETIGAVCIALGLLTRPFAVAALVEFGVIIYHHFPNGYAWIDRGYEYPLFWGLILLAIALRGGGPYSLDRAIGREF